MTTDQIDPGSTAEGRAPAETSTRLRAGVLSPTRALLYALSALQIPILIANQTGAMVLTAGWGAWLAVLVGSAMVALVAVVIARFARLHLATGSLMSYVNLELGRRAGSLVGVALLVGYVAILVGLTCMSLIFLTSFLGGFGIDITGPLPQTLIVLVVLAVCVLLVRQGVSISANVGIILSWLALPFVLILLVAAVVNHGVDLGPQLALEGLDGPTFIAGVVLGSFAVYAGFEGFTALAAETANQQRTVPRLLRVVVLVVAVVLLVGTLLTAGVYQANIGALADGESPLAILAAAGGLPVLGSIGDLLVFVTVLGSLTVYLNNASRIFATAAGDGLLPRFVARVDARRQTPAVAAVCIAVLGLVVFVAITLITAQPIYSTFILVATSVGYAWFVAYIVTTLTGVVHGVRNRLPVFGIVAALALLVSVAVLVYTLVGAAESPVGWVPWTVLGLIAVFWIATLIRRAVAGERDTAAAGSELL